MSLEVYEELVSAVSNLLRIDRQVERFWAVDGQLAKATATSLKAQAPRAIERSGERVFGSCEAEICGIDTHFWPKRGTGETVASWLPAGLG